MQNKKTWKATFQAFWYILPLFIIIGVFNIYPIIKSFAMAFYEDFNIFSGEIGGYGLTNFETLVSDEEFAEALMNTFVYVLFVTPISIILALAVAILLNNIKRLKPIFQSIYFLPFVTSTVAISIVWRWLYHSEYGLINYVLSLFGIDTINWLTNPDWAMPAAIIMAIWKSLGFNILLFLVGLNNIGKTYYDAAKIDGANAWQRFVNVTVPLLGPTIFLVSIISIINNFKVFDEIYALFNGQPGPSNSTITVVYYLYKKFYTEFDYGVASASGIVLFLIIFVITIVQIWFNKRFVHYR